MTRLWRFLTAGSSVPYNLLLRIPVGLIFISAGLQKFLQPEMGVERFAELGFLVPAATALFVGTFELVGGLLVLFGLWTRLAAIPLIVIMLTALATTKVPVLLEDGLWEAFHAARLDLTMLFANILLLLTGPGQVSLQPTGPNTPAEVTEPV
jgi:putative oxidoreductase